MKKGITILSALSVAISVIAILLTGLFLTLLWKPMSSIYTENLQGGPVIPIGSMVYIIGCLCVQVLLLVTCQTKKYIIIEIIPMVILCLILPAIAEIFGVIQQNWLNPLGEVFIVRYVITKSILTISLGLINLSTIISVVSCGMRIAKKAIIKSID